MSEFTEYNDGLAHFQVQINKGEDLVEKAIRVSIHNLSNNALLVSEEIPEPNHPLSILKRSSFRQDFKFKRGEKYSIKVSSTSNYFNPITAIFQHPRARF